MDTLILSRLKRLRQELPNELLSQPKTGPDNSFEYGRACGLVEGVQRAVDAAEEVLKKEDDA